MDTFDVAQLPKLISLTHRVLATRALVFLAVLMAFGLFCWALAVGTVIALAAAATFTLFVFLPILLRCVRKESTDGSDS